MVIHVAGQKNARADYLRTHVTLRDERNDNGRFIVQNDEKDAFLESQYSKHGLEAQILNHEESMISLRRFSKTFCFGEKIKVYEMFA